jgi:signal transduction histidine kinase
MRERQRDAGALLIAALCVAVGLQSLIAPQLVHTGITLAFDDAAPPMSVPSEPTPARAGGERRRLVVESVHPASRAHGMIAPGTTVQEVNYAPWMVIPSSWIDGILRGDFVQLGVATADGGAVDYTFAPSTAIPVGLVLLVGIALLIGIALWIQRGLAGEALRPLAIPLAVAATAPLILAPTSVSPSWAVVAIGVALATLAFLLVAAGWIGMISKPRLARLAAMMAIVAAIGYFAAQLALLSLESARAPIRLVDLALSSGMPEISRGLARMVLVLLATSITVVPAGLLHVAARQGWRTPDRRPGYAQAVWLPLVIASLTPMVVAMTFGYGQPGLGLSVPLVWLLLVLFILHGQSRVETLRIQRDAVVAATEMERARLASDLHDDALQAMTVLVRRLDQTRDAPAADLARSIADRLRDVCGDLRLPVLDELGAGAALEWLVGRVEETSGGAVELERDDPARPPAEIELAVFRVAQEALANAVSHGAPPIRVTYAASSDRAALSVTDQGTGIPPGAAMAAARAGHHGLLNMRQRAEQIGGLFEVGQSPGGGTTIRLRWSSP